MTKKLTTIPIEHKVLAVIDNFQCDLAEIELGKNLWIRRIDTLDENEQAAFAGEEWEQRFVGHNLVRDQKHSQTFTFVRYQAASGEQITRTRERGNHVLNWHFKERVSEPLKEHYDFLLRPNHELESALAGLRILKDAPVGLYPHEDFLIQLPLPKEFPRSTTRPLDGYQLSSPNDVEAYRLESEEVTKLSQLYMAVRSVKQPVLLTALSRLNRQYSRTYIADRLIDAVIALEALYAGDNTNEIALRAGLRISTHLGGSDADQRERYFDLFNLAYNLRSRLVHGGMHNTGEIDTEVKKKGWQSSDTFMGDLDNMLRASLYYILLHIKDKKLKQHLHEPLDKCIRRGEAFIPQSD